MFINLRKCQRLDNLIRLESSPLAFRDELYVLTSGQNGDTISPFPFDMPKHEWAADFLYACIANGLPHTDGPFGGFAYYTQPTLWARDVYTDNWERIGGNPTARLKRIPEESSSPHHFLKGIFGTIERTWQGTSSRFGSCVFRLPDGRLVFAGAGFRVHGWWESQKGGRWSRPSSAKAG